jgi:hypothetical protein
MRPFLDQANQQGPGSLCSDLLSILITQGASPPWGTLGTLHTLRSPSDVWAANISDFCFDDEPCHASPAIGEGARGVVSVWRMVNDGCSVAIRIEPFRYLDWVNQRSWHVSIVSETHPIAKVLQSAAGANAVMGSNMVLAEICSDVSGSNKMMLPCALPNACQNGRRNPESKDTHQTQRCHCASTLPRGSGRMMRIELFLRP